jgi:hypothetical protein
VLNIESSAPLKSLGTMEDGEDDQLFNEEKEDEVRSIN